MCKHAGLSDALDKATSYVKNFDWSSDRALKVSALLTGIAGIGLGACCGGQGNRISGAIKGGLVGAGLGGLGAYAYRAYKYPERALVDKINRYNNKAENPISSFEIRLDTQKKTAMLRRVPGYVPRLE